MLNTQTKILLLVFAGLVLVYLLYNGSTENFKPEQDNSNNKLSDNIDDNDMKELPISTDSVHAGSSVQTPQENCGVNRTNIPEEDMIKYFPPNDYSPPEGDWANNKFNGKNKAASGQYKKSSYSGAKRGALGDTLGDSTWNTYFDNNNNVIGNSQPGNNDNFMPIDETNGGFAVFKSKGQATCGSNQNCEPEDLFDVDKYLPQEVNDDWFEVQPEPISVKNRHLINVSRPAGVNTIGSSLKNASYDLRASPPNPKQIVSPWLQSSISPDTNIKPLF